MVWVHPNSGRKKQLFLTSCYTYLCPQPEVVTNSACVLQFFCIPEPHFLKGAILFYLEFLLDLLKSVMVISFPWLSVILGLSMWPPFGQWDMKGRGAAGKDSLPFNMKIPQETPLLDIVASSRDTWAGCLSWGDDDLRDMVAISNSNLEQMPNTWVSANRPVLQDPEDCTESGKEHKLYEGAWVLPEELSRDKMPVEKWPENTACQWHLPDLHKTPQ